MLFGDVLQQQLLYALQLAARRVLYSSQEVLWGNTGGFYSAISSASARSMCVLLGNVLQQQALHALLVAAWPVLHSRRLAPERRVHTHAQLCRGR